MKYSLNISLFFGGKNLIDSLYAAKRLGFNYVECWFPYDYDIINLREIISENELKLIGINAPPGNTEKGDWGILNDPRRTQLFRESFYKALNYARKLGCNHINILIGNNISKLGRDKQIKAIINNLKEVAPIAQEYSKTILLEAINSYGYPDYLINNSSESLQIIKAVGMPNVKFLYDVYHMQLMEGNLTRTICDNLDLIGHIQIADVPDRHEPGTGEINFSYLLNRVKEAGYRNFVGLEYTPSSTEREAVRWIEKLL